MKYENFRRYRGNLCGIRLEDQTLIADQSVLSRTLIPPTDFLLQCPSELVHFRMIRAECNVLGDVIGWRYRRIDDKGPTNEFYENDVYELFIEND